MRIGMVGLGRMGANMSRRLARAGHEVVAHDVTAGAAGALAAEEERVEAADGLDDLVGRLAPRRVVWVMVPAGAPTAEAVAGLVGRLDEGDIVINGANSRWTDSVAQARAAADHGIIALDAGVSGGVWGLDAGYCLMLGGPEEACAHVGPILDALAPPGGHARVGDSGAGHFVKMVHNGIEYALMQAYAEGFELLESSEYDLDLPRVADLWRHGSVVRSWLLDLAASALAERGGDLSDLAPYVEDSGEGRWTVEAGVEQAVPLPAITAALFARFSSRRDSFGDRLLAALRQQFGGHAVKEAE